MKATVLIPTYNNGPLLEYALRSAMAQSESEIEILVVGDGSPPETAALVERMIEEDRRIQFFQFEKGPRNGEIHRHTVLQQSRGNIICYLSDDDLWFPDHVEQCLRALASADIASTLTSFLYPNGDVVHMPGDFGYPQAISLISRRNSLVPLPGLSHSRALYDKLEGGWQTTPPGFPATDLYMIQRLLGIEGVVGETAFVPTCLHFAAAHRTDMPPTDRLKELQQWWGVMRDARRRTALRQTLYEAICRQFANRVADAAHFSLAHKRRAWNIDITAMLADQS